jgi:transcription elongation factor GreB
MMILIIAPNVLAGIAEVVDPETPRMGQAMTSAFFGATVRYAYAAGTERVASIVGTDEVDLNRNHVSWVSLWGVR